MVRKISSVGSGEQEGADPYEKWAAYDEFYVLSEEVIEAINSGGLGKLLTPSGLDIKVERYTLSDIKNNLQIREKIARSLEIGAVGFGKLAHVSTHFPGLISFKPKFVVRFREDIAQALNKGVIKREDLAENFQTVTLGACSVASLSAAKINELAKGLLQAAKAANEAAAIFSEDAKKQTAEIENKEEQTVAKEKIASYTVPKVAVSIARAPLSPRKKEETRAAEAMINQKIHSAEHHRQKREKQKKERKKHRKEEIIQHEILKVETKQREIKSEKIRKEKKV